MSRVLPRQDVSTDAVNPHHHGNGQSARVAPGSHVSFKPNTMVYDGMGRPMGKVTGGAGGINAVGTDKLVLPGSHKPVSCVYAWSVQTNAGPVSGWVPLSALRQRVKVGNEERAIDTRVARATGSSQGHRYTPFNVVTRSAKSAGADNLYVFPNQQSPTANKASYFFSRTGGEAQMYLNVPVKGDSGRFGVGNDMLPPSARFHVDDDVKPQKVGLYHRKSSTEAGHLYFVYGYVVNDAGQKRHGWINGALLTPATNKRAR